MNLQDRVKIVFKRDKISNTSVFHKSKKLTHLIISYPIKYREKRINDVLNHEIGTHCLRKYNDLDQIWYQKRSKFKMGPFLHTEEGLACIHSLYQRA